MVRALPLPRVRHHHWVLLRCPTVWPVPGTLVYYCHLQLSYFIYLFHFFYYCRLFLLFHLLQLLGLFHLLALIPLCCPVLFVVLLFSIGVSAPMVAYPAYEFTSVPW